MDVILLLKSLATGFAVGAIFSLIKLPIPAPPELPGIVGIVGIFLGFVVVKMFTR